MLPRVFAVEGVERGTIYYDAFLLTLTLEGLGGTLQGEGKGSDARDHRGICVGHSQQREGRKQACMAFPLQRPVVPFTLWIYTVRVPLCQRRG